ncbi:uncharacterized protein LOC144707589 [Wolffia australiana]
MTGETKEDVHSLVCPDIISGEEEEEENPQKIDYDKISSSQKLDIGENGRVLPHYLRSSGPSCHDYCKYGIKHDLEPKREFHFTSPHLTINRRTAPNGENSKNSPSQAKREISSKLNKNRGFHQQSSVEYGESSSTRERMSLVKTGYLKTINEEHIFKEKYSIEVHTTVDYKSSVCVSKKYSRPKILVKVPSLKRVSSTGRTRRLDKTRTLTSNEHILRKPSDKGAILVENPSSPTPLSDSSLKKPSSSPSLRPLQKDKTRALKKNPSLKNRVFNSYLKRDIESTKVQTSRGDELSNIGKSKPQGDSKMTKLRPSLGLLQKSTSGSKTESGKDGESADETKRRTRLQSSYATPKVPSPKENVKGRTREKEIPVIERSRSIKDKVKGKGLSSIPSKRAPKVNSGGTNPSAKMLTFRAGKTVNTSPSNEETPKILKFRQAKRVYAGLGDARRWSFKRKESFKGQSSRQPSIGNLKVVLRPLDIKDKKENQSLLNEVIELTANKLAETSKSKVKALVGAFESVISRR